MNRKIKRINLKIKLESFSLRRKIIRQEKNWKLKKLNEPKLKLTVIIII